MADDKKTDQDAATARWDASLNAGELAISELSGATEDVSDTMAAQWAAMVEDTGRSAGNGKVGTERVLSQEEIDNLLGFSVGDINLNDAWCG